MIIILKIYFSKYIVCVSADMSGSSITGKLTVGGRTIFEKSLSGCMIDTF